MKKANSKSLPIQFIESITKIENLPNDTFRAPDRREVDSGQMKEKLKELLNSLVR